MRKYTGEQKLSKMVRELSERKEKSNYFESDFDDRNMSNTPQTVLVSRDKIRMLGNLLEMSQGQNKQQKLKVRSKSEINKMLWPSSMSSNEFCSQRLQIKIGSKAKISSMPFKVNSEIIHMRKLATSLNKREISMSPSYREPIALDRYVQQKMLNLRSRVNQVNISKRRISQNPESGKKIKYSFFIDNSDSVGRKETQLEPWKLNEDFEMEEPVYIRKRLLLK